MGAGPNSCSSLIVAEALSDPFCSGSAPTVDYVGYISAHFPSEAGRCIRRVFLVNTQAPKRKYSFLKVLVSPYDGADYKILSKDFDQLKARQADEEPG